MEDYIILRSNRKQLKLETNLRELFQNKVCIIILAVNQELFIFYTNIREKPFYNIFTVKNLIIW